MKLIFQVSYHQVGANSYPNMDFIKVGMLPRKSKRVWTLTASRERLPLAQLQSQQKYTNHDSRLLEIVLID